MTDNRTTELRDKLDALNIEHFDYDKGGRTQTQWETPDGKRHFTYETSNNPAKTARLVIAWHPTPEQAIAATLGGEINGDTSDGYHTFNELYHHRAVLFSVVVANHRGIAWKSKLHHDGTMYDGMFIVGLDTPWGQASYHYDIDPYWDMFDCEERESAPEWDGHTPDDAIERIGKLVTLGGGKLTAEQVRETVEKHWHDLSADYDMPEATALPEYSYDWQAIADELNAELGGGNCARCAEDMGRYADSLCDPLKERIAELLRCLENDWHIHASWDGLRKFWCIELTEEGVKLRDAAHAERTCKSTTDDNAWCFVCSECGKSFPRSNLHLAHNHGEINYCPNCGARVVDA